MSDNENEQWRDPRDWPTAMAHASHEGCITLLTESEEVMRFDPGGRITIRGEVVDDNAAVYRAFREWLAIAAARGVARAHSEEIADEASSAAADLRSLLASFDYTPPEAMDMWTERLREVASRMDAIALDLKRTA